MEELHIGQHIKARAKEVRIGATELGRIINTSKQNIYGIFKRRTIDTGLLMKLSQALDFDFFSLYIKEDTHPEEDARTAEHISKLYQNVQSMRNEIDELKVKYESLTHRSR